MRYNLRSRFDNRVCSPPSDPDQNMFLPPAGYPQVWRPSSVQRPVLAWSALLKPSEPDWPPPSAKSVASRDRSATKFRLRPPILLQRSMPLGAYQQPVSLAREQQSTSVPLPFPFAAVPQWLTLRHLIAFHFLH